MSVFTGSVQSLPGGFCAAWPQRSAGADGNADPCGVVSANFVFRNNTSCILTKLLYNEEEMKGGIRMKRCLIILLLCGPSPARPRR